LLDVQNAKTYFRENNHVVINEIDDLTYRCYNIHYDRPVKDLGTLVK